MNLREQLRNEWSTYIRPLMVKDECEWCGCKEDLHLHHIDRFHNLLVETLEELQLQELDTEDYEEFELKQISNFMLAKQLKIEYKTLCRECHMKLHAKEKFTDEYKNHYYNPNGGYIIVNSDEIAKLDIEDNMLVRFLQICCHCNYDGVLTDKRRKVKVNSIANCEFLLNILKVKEREMYRTLKYLIEKELISINDEVLSLNKKYVGKGFVNFKTKYKIFSNNYISMYDKLTPREHKTIGCVINCDIRKEDLIVYNLIIDKTNSSRFKNKLANIGNGNFKSVKNKIIINPSLIYYGSLDYSYKEKIDEFKMIDDEKHNINKKEIA